MRTATVTQAKARLSALVEDVRGTGEALQLTKNGEVVAVLVSLREYEELLETLDVLSDPELMKQIRASRGQARAGRLRSHEDVFGEPL